MWHMGVRWGQVSANPISKMSPSGVGAIHCLTLSGFELFSLPFPWERKLPLEILKGVEDKHYGQGGINCFFCLWCLRTELFFVILKGIIGNYPKQEPRELLSERIIKLDYLVLRWEYHLRWYNFLEIMNTNLNLPLVHMYVSTLEWTRTNINEFCTIFSSTLTPSTTKVVVGFCWIFNCSVTMLQELGLMTHWTTSKLKLS